MKNGNQTIKYELTPKAEIYLELKETYPPCICGHGAQHHAEFLDRAPTSKLVEKPILKHCVYGWSASKSFACNCPVYVGRK